MVYGVFIMELLNVITNETGKNIYDLASKNAQ